MSKKNLVTIAASMFLSGMLLGGVLGLVGKDLITDVTYALLVAAFVPIGAALLIRASYEIYGWAKFMDNVYEDK